MLVRYTFVLHLGLKFVSSTALAVFTFVYVKRAFMRSRKFVVDPLVVKTILRKKADEVDYYKNKISDVSGPFDCRACVEACFCYHMYLSVDVVVQLVSLLCAVLNTPTHTGCCCQRLRRGSHRCLSRILLGRFPHCARLLARSLSLRSLAFAIHICFVGLGRLCGLLLQ